MLCAAPGRVAVGSGAMLTKRGRLLTDRCCQHDGACGLGPADGDLGHHHPGRDVVCIDAVSYRYPDAEQPAVADITLHVAARSRLGIIGPNGAGKSTLVKLILGLIQPQQGSIAVDGQAPGRATRRGDVVGYVPQKHEAAWRFPVSARQVVMMGLTGKAGLLRRPAPADRDYADAVMRQVGVAELAAKPVGTLSGGQQQRVFIARALAPRPKVLVLDEPTVGIDEAGQQRFADLLDELRRTMDLTVILVSHDLRAVAAGCDRIACLARRIHYHDTPAGLTEEVLREVFQHEIGPVLGARA
jgi:zinc transport system ATP-binding protein